MPTDTHSSHLPGSVQGMALASKQQGHLPSSFFTLASSFFFLIKKPCQLDGKRNYSSSHMIHTGDWERAPRHLLRSVPKTSFRAWLGVCATHTCEAPPPAVSVTCGLCPDDLPPVLHLTHQHSEECAVSKGGSRWRLLLL